MRSGRYSVNRMLGDRSLGSPQLPESEVYNLIILDESGSMAKVTGQTIGGCNEILDGIRSIAMENSGLRQYVSIYCFDTSNSRYIFHNTPIENVGKIHSDDYHPNSGTPLYDAIGDTVSQLRQMAGNSSAIAKVAIITDGYENASQRWNHVSIVDLIDGLKQRGWLFTFMGANIDVELTSRALGINSFLEFQQSDQGVRDMFMRERNSQKAYARKLSFLRSCKTFMTASEEVREQLLGLMNENYFTDGMRIAPDVIRTLGNDEIFVFGSDAYGRHNGVYAGLAVSRFGAQKGKAEGLQGQSYAIPVEGASEADFMAAVARFTEYAVLHPGKKFILSPVGCGRGGYTPERVAPWFKQAYGFGNVYVPTSFITYVEDGNKS